MALPCFAQSIQQASLTQATVGQGHPAAMLSTANNNAASGASLTVSAVTVSGTQPAMIVVLSWASGITLRTSTSVTSGTGSQNLVRLASTNFVSTKQFIEIWGVLGPTTGDVVATLSGSATGGIDMFAQVWTNVGSLGANAQVEPTGSQTATTLTISPSVWSDTVVDCSPFSSPVAGAGQTVIGTIVGSVVLSSSWINATAPNTTVSWTGNSLTAPGQAAIVLHGGAY